MNVFKRLFRPFLEEKIEKEEKTDTGYYEMDEETKAFISLFAKYIAVDYVATCLSRVPIKTIQNGKEIKATYFICSIIARTEARMLLIFSMNFGFAICGTEKCLHLNTTKNGSWQTTSVHRQKTQQNYTLNPSVMAISV